MRTLVLLHGFAGTHRSWDEVVARLGRERYRCLPVDLRGHGDASARRPISFDACAADVLEVADGPFDLCGYSLGGRVALHVALAAPERVGRLVLAACQPGIADELERAARLAADEQLAAWVEANPIEAFVERWMALPLFDGTPPDAAARWRADLLRNEPAGVAAALRGLGAGTMASRWPELGQLRMPVDVVAGARDAKYVAIAEQMAAALPDAALHVIPGAGHGLPREAPVALAELLARAR